MPAPRLQWHHRHSWLLIAFGASGHRYEVQRLGADKWLATKFETRATCASFLFCGYLDLSNQNRTGAPP